MMSQRMLEHAKRMRRGFWKDIFYVLLWLFISFMIVGAAVAFLWPE